MHFKPKGICPQFGDDYDDKAIMLAKLKLENEMMRKAGGRVTFERSVLLDRHGALANQGSSLVAPDSKRRLPKVG